MSIVPIFAARFVGCFLVGVFLWKLWLLIVFVLLMILFIIIYVHDSLLSKKFHYESAFWLFIFSEIMIFGRLFLCCLYYDSSGKVNLSDPLEIPFLGCFLLLGSSVTITGFHHLLGWAYSWILLLFTIILGMAFVVLQIYEIWECEINLLSTRFYAGCFCTVGTHSSHVLLGVIGMCIILWTGVFRTNDYYCTVITWYWHFVDYIWLFVYIIVYVC